MLKLAFQFINISKKIKQKQTNDQLTHELTILSTQTNTIVNAQSFDFYQVKTIFTCK